jgi:hypothetical protein
VRQLCLVGRRARTKGTARRSMVRRRSTVRFRNGAPAQRNNSNLSNRLREPFREPIGPGSSHDQDRLAVPPPVCRARPSGQPCPGPARRRAGSSEWRAGSTAHQVPWTVPVTYLGKPLLDQHESAVRAGGHVTVGQHAGKVILCRLELGTQDAGKPAFFGFDDGAGVMGDQPAQDGSACRASRRNRAPSS